MAQSGTTAPKKGRETIAQKNAEIRRLEEQLKGKEANKGLWTTAIVLLLVLGLVIAGIWFFVNHRSDNAAEEPNSMPTSSGEPGTGYESGSWGEVAKTLQDQEILERWNSMNEEMANYRGFLIPYEAIQDHVVREVETGDPLRYLWTADRDLPGWLNTNWDELPAKIICSSFVKGDQFLVMELEILAKYGVDVSVIPNEALVVLPDGTVCVILARAKCTNHVWPGKFYTEGNGDDDDEVKGPNPWPNFIADHQAGVPVPPGTPGYIPGTAEDVTEEQKAAPIGGLDPTPVGTPGTDAGGVTPPGTTELPDGTVVVTPPPPVGEPAPPPPLIEVPPGAVVDEPG